MNHNAVNQIQRILQTIEDQLETPIDRNELIRMSFFSSAAFYPLFQDLVGTSLKDYIQRRRLSLSCHDLIESHDSILAIALRYQYGSYESYSRAFKRLTGSSPRQYRLRGDLLIPFGRITLVENQVGGKTKMKRRMNQEQLQKLIGESSGFLLDIDIDNFEEVNVQYSRPAGDAILAEVANRINQVLDEFNIPAQAIRIHNDEFITTIPDSFDQPEVIVQKIMDVLRLPYDFKGESIQITVSIGITPFERHQEWTQSVNRAEAAMKKAKKRGKDNFVQS